MGLAEATSRLKGLQSQAHRLEGVYEQYSRRHVELTDEVEKLDRLVLLRIKASAVLKRMLDEEVADKVKDIDEIVTKGLQQVYHDQDVSFTSQVEEKNNRLSVEFATRHGEIEGDTLDSFGGGIVNITSFLLRAVILFKMGLAPYLQLDESFNNVSREYRGYTAKMLQILCRQLKIDVLLVTHQPEFLEHVDSGYEAVAVPGGEMKLHKIRGNS